jgi:hypothetical protein
MGCEEFKQIKPIHYQRYVEEILSKKKHRNKEEASIDIKRIFQKSTYSDPS